MASRTAHRTGVYGVLLLAAGLYASTASHGFVYEDAQWQDLVRSAPTAYPWPGRGVTYLSQWLTSQTAAGTHLGNVCLHLMNGVLLYALVRRLLSPLVAVGAVSVFLLNPLSSSAVAYATGRADLLVTALVLGGLVVGAADGRGRIVMAVGLLVLAGCAKEIGAVALPLAAWTWRMWRRPSASWAGWACLIALGALAGMAWRPLLTWWEMPARVGGSSLDWPTFLILQLTAVWHLLIVWPRELSIVHDVIGLDPAWRLIAGVLTLQAGCVCVWAWYRAPVVAWAIGWVALSVAPRFVFRSSEFVTEPQMYLALVAPCVLGGLGLAWLWKGSEDGQAVPRGRLFRACSTHVAQ